MSRARDFADLAAAYSGGALGKRNMIRNGNMAVHQRTGTITANGYTLDGWRTYRNSLDEHAFEITQAADVPSTFAGSGGKSLKFQTKTVESALAADEEMRIATLIESQDCQHLLYGGSSAKKFTLSFWVKCSLTGVFAMQIYMDDGGLNIGSTYTINSADTWEYKTVTIVGHTSQAITNDNTIGLYVNWNLFAGSNFTSTDNTSWGTYAAARLAYGHAQNGLATTDESTWFLTGVQMEVGEVATPFEHESYADNLARCQRYFHKIITTATYTRFMVGQATAATTAEHYYEHPVEMRAEPSIGQTGTASNYAIYHNNAVIALSSVPAVNTDQTTKMAVVTTVVASGQTQGEATCLVGNNNASAYIEFNAEL